jgi:hypothetical protein
MNAFLLRSHKFLATLTGFALVATAISTATAAPLFDMTAVRDTSTLEIKVLQDWKPAKDPAIRQKLLEITLCEWWPGQKVRLAVTLNVPAGEKPCHHVVIANQPLSRRAFAPTRGQLTLLKEHGVGVVLIGMGTIDAMEPIGQLHLGMRDQLLKSRNPRYTTAWIWGLSQMRALTAALTEPKYFQPRKVLTTGGSKRGVAAAVAGIFDDRFTAILPVVAPPLGNPGTAAYVMGTEPEELARIDRQFFADLKAGKLGLGDGVEKALSDRADRRAANRVTLKQARAAGWSDRDIATITDQVWDACRVTVFLPALRKRGLDIFYNVGSNDSVTPALRELGRRFPDFPICIIPGGQHGGPSTAGFTRRVPTLPEIQANFLSFARHHFFGHRKLIATPIIAGTWNPDSRSLSVKVVFPDGSEPQANSLWWNSDRSQPYTLPFEYDRWNTAPLRKTGPGAYATSIALKSTPARIDFLSLHTHTEKQMPLTVSSAYRRLETKR